jgi:hypothetical protein
MSEWSERYSAEVVKNRRDRRKDDPDYARKHRESSRHHMAQLRKRKRKVTEKVYRVRDLEAKYGITKWVAHKWRSQGLLPEDTPKFLKMNKSQFQLLGRTILKLQESPELFPTLKIKLQEAWNANPSKDKEQEGGSLGNN